MWIIKDWTEAIIKNPRVCSAHFLSRKVFKVSRKVLPVVGVDNVMCLKICHAYLIRNWGTRRNKRIIS